MSELYYDNFCTARSQPVYTLWRNLCGDVRSRLSSLHSFHNGLVLLGDYFSSVVLVLRHYALNAFQGVVSYSSSYYELLFVYPFRSGNTFSIWRQLCQGFWLPTFYLLYTYRVYSSNSVRRVWMSLYCNLSMVLAHGIYYTVSYRHYTAIRRIRL